MSGERPTNPELPTQIQSTPGGAVTPVPDGTLVVAHGADVKSASSMKVDYAVTGADSHLSLIGRMVGPYRIQAELGAGGMGAVYLAEQLEPVRRQVALKVIKAGMDSEEVLSRFQSERELLARMNHPNIAQVLDVGATPEGRLYFAMEYVPGVPVNEFCDRRGMDVAHRLELFLQICEGVQHAHQKGVIHRDLKPSNLMVADYQGQLLVKVIDFGIAKSMDTHARGDTGSTRMGVPIGTPAYMSPEQAAGDLAAIDTRTDVYSLGVVLYRLITHDLPISSDTIAKAMDTDLARVLREASIRPPSRKVLEIAKDSQVNQTDWKRAMSGDAQSLSRTLKGDLDWITLKALERDREMRYASVSELAADVRRYLQGEVVLAGPPSKVYRARKFIARNKLAVGAAAAVVLSLILGIIGTTYMTIEARQQRERAEAALLEAQKQRDRAAEESARAIATRSFLEEMIAAPDPWKLQGGSPETRNVRVVDALQAAAANLDKSLADNPALRGEVATMLGRTLRRLGKLDASREQLERATRDLAQPGSGESPELVLAQVQLAITLGEQGEFEASDALFTKWLPRLEAMPDVAQDVLTDARRSAAVSAVGVGDGERAERLARENLRLAESNVGHASSVSGAKASLADILGERGEWDEAEQLLTDAYTNEQLRLGRNHPLVVQLLSLRATLAYRKGDYLVAEERYREAARLSEQALGPAHPETLRFAAHAIMAVMDGGRVDAALKEFRDQIPVRSEAMGANHPDVLTMRANYANALRAAGQLDAAEAEIEDVFRRRRETLGETHPDTLSAINILGVIARQRKDSAKAELLFRQASQLYLKAKGPMHPESIMMQANHLAAVRDLGRIDEAVAGMGELLKRAEQVMPADHWFIAVIRSHLGLALMEANKFDESEPMLKGSYEMMLKQFGDDDARTRAFRSRLVDLYTRWGKPRQADAYR